MIDIKFKRVEKFYFHCSVTHIYSITCTVIYNTVRKPDLKSSYPLMAVQPLLGLGLPQKTPAFFSVFCSSPPFSYS
jgi:hypothetical protein